MPPTPGLDPFWGAFGRWATEAAGIAVERRLLVEVAVLQHSGDFDHATQLHLAPAAPDGGSAKGSRQCRGRRVESRDLLDKTAVRGHPLAFDLGEARVDLLEGIGNRLLEAGKRRLRQIEEGRAIVLERVSGERLECVTQLLLRLFDELLRHLRARDRSRVPPQVLDLSDLDRDLGGLVDDGRTGGEVAAGGVGDTGVEVDLSMALAWDGKLYTWGRNDFGEMGVGNFNESFVPQHVSALTTPVVSFATGGYHALALLEDGTLRGWGYNGSGAVGDGTTENRSSPVLVSGGLPKAIELISGRFHSIAFLGDFRLFTWGNNAGGQLGDSTLDDRSSPV